MSKSILISIRPEFVSKILNGEKTIEIRKTMPKCELPCKVYIYCTKDNKNYLNRKDCRFCYIEKRDVLGVTDKVRELFDNVNGFYERLNGQVVAEFTLNKIDLLVDYGFGIHYVDKELKDLDLDFLRTNSCLTDEQIYFYLGLKKNSGYYNDGYVWHIDDLIIYDKPKELSEFDRPEIDLASEDCRYGVTCPMYKNKKIKRPPQSWCYVEQK